MIKKVFFLIPYLQKGGSEKVIINLANNFSSKGFEVSIIVFNNKSDYNFLINSDVDIIDLKTNRALFSFFKLRKILKIAKPHILISALTHVNVLACFSSLFINNKVIVLEHIPVISHIKQKWLNLLVYIISIFAYKFSNYVISSCKKLDEDLKKYLFVPKRKIKTFYCPVVSNQYLDLSKEKINNLIFNSTDVNSKIIISIARLERQKDYVSAIFAIKKLVDENYDIKYFILGKGSLEKKLKKIVINLNLNNNIFFLGFKKNPYKYLKKSNLLLLTSRYEAFGVVIVESLMLGVPVVATDCYCGPAEILSSKKYGELAKVGDINSIAYSIKKVISNKYNESDLIKRSDFFSVDNISNMYIELLNKENIKL